MSCVATLKEKGLKLTPQRMLIVDIIHDAREHLTAEEIIGYVQKKMPGINKSTVYRTLEILVKAGCVYKSGLGNDFVYHHAEEGHHHHLLCTRCGQTINCDEDLFAPLKKSLMEKYRFHADFKHMVMSGICGECRSRNN
jgi:Fur family ferric uptake transcriptional regulator